MSHQPVRIPAPGPWATLAACRGAPDRNRWFPGPGPGSADAAIAVCDACPVEPDCLAYAYRWRIEHGVWGGQNEDTRRRILRRRRRLTVVG